MNSIEGIQLALAYEDMKKERDQLRAELAQAIKDRDYAWSKLDLISSWINRLKERGAK